MSRSGFRIVVFTERYVLEAGLRATLSELGRVDAVESLSEVGECNVLIVELPEWSRASLQAIAALGVPAIAWCASPSAEFARMVMDRGIRGVLGDDAPAGEIMSAAVAVSQGELWLPAGVTTAMLGGQSYRMTTRESQLVKLLCGGLRNREIADSMGVTEGTVKVYLSRLFDKTGARDRFELTMLAFRSNGMTVGGTARSGITVAPREEPIRLHA